jgi:polysaccharide export outer membrane protein
MFGTIRAGAAARGGAWLTCTAVLLAGCADQHASMPRGPAAYEALRNDTPPSVGEARILPSDKLDVHVLYEPDLSRQLRVDSQGSIEMPFAGQIEAGGKTPRELADLIQTRLARYIKTPQVDVSVLSTASDHVTVEGNVNDPGVFDIAGSASLLEVLARAKSPNRTAALNQIVVFRTVDGQRVAAVFDIARIRRGVDQDPTLYPGDKVVVGFSFIKGAFRDFLQAAPVIAVFRPY